MGRFSPREQPGLVAAVTAADWPPHDLLAAAAEHLHDIAATQTIRPDEYAALVDQYHA